MKVTPRTKKISNNKESCYLDFYPPYYNSHTRRYSRREFLNLFVYSEYEHEVIPYTDKNGKQKTKIVEVKDKNGNPKKRKLSLEEKIHNENTLGLVQKIAGEKQIAITNDHFEAPNKSNGNSNFIKYFEDLVEEQENPNTYANWNTALKYLKDYTGNNVQFKTITEKFCEGFRGYLLKANSLRRSSKKLSRNSANSYFIKFQSAIKKAFQDGYLKKNMNARVKSIGEDEVYKDYLTIEELQKLVVTPFKYPILKRALLFDAMTGLRFKDVKKMKWSDIRKNMVGYSYQFIQQKKKRQEHIPLNETAVALMGPERDSNDFVFGGMKEHINDKIKEWIRSAGIDKEITWHNFRHSFSSNLLDLDVDFYTIMHLLTQRGGLKHLPVTYRYAHPTEKRLREATNRLKLDLSKLDL